MPINGYFDTVFGVDGELVVIQDGITVDGTVNYTQGWTVNYTLPSSNPSYKYMPWGQFNQLFYDITGAIQYLQQNDAPAFITTAMNLGSPYSYPKYARVNYSGVNYISLQNSNTDTPPSSKWAISFGGISGSFTAGHLAVFADSNGTIADGGPPSTYTLPKATTSVLGGVIVDGTTISVNGSGVISVAGLGTAASRTASDPTKTYVASVNGSVTIGHLASFSDIHGTIVDSGTTFRTLLNTNTNVYVNASTGSDSNNGTSGSPWLTIQHAINVIQSSIDFNGFSVTINLSGTFTAGGSINGALVGGINNPLIIDGGGSGIINVGSSSICVEASGYSIVKIQNITLESSGSASYGADAANGAEIIIGSGVTFGAFSGGAHLSVSQFGNIQSSSNYTISGSALSHLNLSGFGTISMGGNTVTLTGTPAFSTAFASCSNNSSLFVIGTTFSGSATGSRYTSFNNGVINTAGGGASYLPGSTSGSTSNGGLYV